MERKVRVGIVGCGKVGGLHAAALQQLPGAELAAVCDALLSRATSFAERYGGQAYGSPAELCQHAGCEVLLICTPHPLHEEPVLQAAKAGIHVLVEKPLSHNLAACDRMLAAADAHGIKLGVVSQRRYFEAVQRVKQAIDAGKIGRPILGVFQMYSWRDAAYYASDPWRGKWATEGGGVLVNQSPHQLDMLQWFMGEIEEVSGYWGNLNHPEIEVDDTAVAVIRFRSGGLGSIVTSVSQRPGIYTKVHVHGSNGASVGVQTDAGATFVAGMSGIAAPPLNDVWTIPGEEHLLKVWEAEDRARFAKIDPTVHYHQLQIADFLQAVRDDRDPLVTGREGRIVVELFTAIYRSQQERRPISFPVTA
jgi:predicted dehydrogenase